MPDGTNLSREVRRFLTCWSACVGVLVPVLLIACGSETPAEPEAGRNDNNTGGASPDLPQGPFLSDPWVSSVSCEGQPLCEGFETNAVDEVPGGPWGYDVSSNSTMAITDERAASGLHSLKVVAGAGASATALARATLSEVFGAAPRRFFGRMMLWLDAPPDEDAHTTFVEAAGASLDGTYEAKYRFGTQRTGRFMANYDTDGKNTDCWDHSQVPMPTKEWSCIEWRFDGEANTLRLWVNGQRLHDIDIEGHGSGCLGHDLDDQWIAPSAFEVLSIGWQRYQSANEQRLWLDDLVVSAERVGCPASAM